MSIQLELHASPAASTQADGLIVGLYADGRLSGAAEALDQASQGALRKRFEAGDLKGKPGSTQWLFDLPGVVAPRVLVVGLGKSDPLAAGDFLKAVEAAGKALASRPVKYAASWLGEVAVHERDRAWCLRTEALAVAHAGYRWQATLAKRREEVKVELESLTMAAADPAAPTARAALAEASAIAEGVRFARELGNTPPNICNPAWLAEQARAFAATQEGVSIDILEREAMTELGMHSLLAVARGSRQDPRLIVLHWQGGSKDQAPMALVGKGVTFDAGGLDIKTAAGMEQMKFDMCGAAGVLGAFVAAVRLRLPINLVCAVAAVENMPDGDSYRPGDVLTTLSGQTVEVLNTDAEGRLILCDTLTYVQRFKPRAIVDAATLTGACVVALGKHASGLMSKHDDLAEELLAAGEKTLDRAWRLPLWDDYQSALESAFADFAHLGSRAAGAITAGCFLSRFTEGQRWAHLDIAGTAWDDGRKGLATGRPVALLTQWLMDRC